MADQNLPTAFFNTVLVTERATETPFADWYRGVNAGGSCSMGIGIASGVINPKESDWSREESGPLRAYQLSSYIGIGESTVTFYRDSGLDTNDNVGFGTANAGDSLPGEDYDDFLVLTNRTGETILLDEFAWGPNEQPPGPPNGVILTDGIALGVVPATFYNPINITLTGGFLTGTVTIDIGGVTDDGPYALIALPIAINSTIPEAAQQIADALNLLDDVSATAFERRVIIQPKNTVATPDNKDGPITLVNYDVNPV